MPFSFLKCNNACTNRWLQVSSCPALDQLYVYNIMLICGRNSSALINQYINYIHHPYCIFPLYFFFWGRGDWEDLERLSLAHSTYMKHNSFYLVDNKDWKGMLCCWYINTECGFCMCWQCLLRCSLH